MRCDAIKYCSLLPLLLQLLPGSDLLFRIISPICVGTCIESSYNGSSMRLAVGG